MEKFASIFSRWRQAGVLVFWLLIAARPGSTAPKPVVAPAPPPPMARKVTVRREASVEIPLKIFGTRAQTLSWIIREQPRHGRLSAVRALTAEAAVVTYWPMADLRFTGDRFTFSVRSNEGVSAPVEVAIAILDDAPQIGGVSELDFGTVLAGARPMRALEFMNRGGGVAEGTLEVNAPWKVDGSRAYRLAAGEREMVKLVFAPERAGRFAGEVKFTSQPDRTVALRGEAVESLAVAPAGLTLGQVPGHPLRVASFDLRNNTDEALAVTLTVSQRLIVENRVLLEPHQTASLAVQAAENDVAALDETIHFTAGKQLSARLSVRAMALPALVRASPESVRFWKADPTGKERIVFENRGGTEAQVTLSVGMPFVTSESAFVLALGGVKEIEVWPGSGAGEEAQGFLRAEFGSGSLEIPLEVRRVSLPEIVPGARKVSFSPRREAEPSEGLASASPGVLPAVLDGVSATSATFHWKGAASPGAGLRCLERVLDLDANGDLVTSFREYAACKFVQTGAVGSATVEKLEPGKFYYFQIEESRPDGPNVIAFTQLRTLSPAPRKSFFSALPLLIALAVIVGAVVIRQRWRPAGGF